MRKRSFFLTLAAGLLASVAFTTPSHAATVYVVTTDVVFSLPAGATGTFTDLSVTYTPTVAPITSLALSPLSLPAILTVGTPPAPGPDTVTATFGAVSSGHIRFTFDESASAPPIRAGSFSFSGSATGITDTVIITTTSAVPEPSTMALLGIGVTALLAYRRVFKRTSVA